MAAAASFSFSMSVNKLSTDVENDVELRLKRSNFFLTFSRSNYLLTI